MESHPIIRFIRVLGEVLRWTYIIIVSAIILYSLFTQ